MEECISVIEAITTYQGEGKFSGTRILLLRFKYCSRGSNPCPFCDTQVKLRILNEMQISLDSIQTIVNEKKVNLLLTGGCPTFGSHFNDTLLVLNKIRYPAAFVESNGYKLFELISKVRGDKNVYYTYSPKFFNINELEEEIRKSEKLKDFHNVIFKIVFQNKPLEVEFLEFLSTFNINQNVYLMPQGVTKEELIKNSEVVLDACEKYKFNFSSRQHIIYDFV